MFLKSKSLQHLEGSNDIIKDAKASLMNPTRPMTPCMRNVNPRWKKTRLYPLMDESRDSDLHFANAAEKQDYKHSHRNSIKVETTDVFWIQLKNEIKSNASFHQIHTLLDEMESHSFLSNESIKKQECIQLLMQKLNTDSIPSKIAIHLILIRLQVKNALLESCLLQLVDLSCDSENDAHFLQNKTILVLLRIAKQHDWTVKNAEIMVDLMGLLKNLSFNSEFKSEMRGNGIFSLLKLILKNLNVFSNQEQLLIHVTELHRNLINDEESTQDLLYHSDCLRMVVESTLERKKLSESLIFNIVRIQSKLSLYPCIQSLLSENQTLDFLMHHVNQCKDESIVLRIFFILGNLTMIQGKVHVYLRKHIDLILELFEYFSCKENVDDLMIKIIRCIGNLALDEECGMEICAKEEMETFLSFFGIYCFY